MKTRQSHRNQSVVKAMLFCFYIFSCISVSAHADWDGAKWIGAAEEDLPLYSHYLSVFRINYTVQFSDHSASAKAEFIYGANDERLMDRNRNIYNIQSKRDSSFIRIELDATVLPAKLNIYRKGYAPTNNGNVPLFTFEISKSIINQENKFAPHVVSIHSNMGITQIFIDDDKKEEVFANFVLNPYGRGGDFFAYPVLGDIGFSEKISDVEIRNFREPSNVLRSFRKSAGNIIFNPSANSMPMLRSNFEITGPKIDKATLCVTARGIYDFYINNKRINDGYFNPGASQYNKTHFYQVYDVTKFLRKGKNTMGAILGEGWWSGAITYAGESWNFFGDRQSLLAKLVITYADGTETVIPTSPDTWQYYNNGPTITAGFFNGEVYDARREVAGWSNSDFEPENWKKAKEITLEGNTAAFDYSAYSLVELTGQTVKPIMKLTAVSVTEVRPGVFVYDMGQNFAGVPEIHLSGMKQGTKINLRFAEVKYPDLPEYKQNTGMIMLENIRSAMAQDIYICKGGDEEVFSPRFTYHGYRFVEITGLEKALALKDIKGIVLSSIDNVTADYECSNPEVNRLWQNIKWSAFSNFVSIPTDCPQRNERLGWSGDISVFSRTAVYMADVRKFLSRYLRAMRDCQNPDGRFPDVAPFDFGFGGLLWGSAGITVAWETYLQYADTELLAEHYDAMKRYIEFVQRNYIDTQTNVIVQNRTGLDLGDWLSPEEEKNDRSLLWEAYFIYDLDIMQRIALKLNKKDDAAMFAQISSERKSFFNETYIDKTTGKTISSGYYSSRIYVPEKGKVVDTQSSYALPLAFGIVNKQNKPLFLKNFIETIRRENILDKKQTCPPYSLMTGFIGTAWISKALSDNGFSADAYRLLQQTSYPSWLYPVEQGATTIWERLNSYTHTDGFGGNNRMNSFNHYSFGAVGAWLIENSLGIRRDENNPGFRHFILSPEIDITNKMAYARGYYNSPYGKIESMWKTSEGKTIYNFTVPKGTTATLYFPLSAKYTLKKGKTANESQENGKMKFELKEGKYEFEAK